MIYFAQPTDGGPVKIGHSVDVPARLRALESHYRRPLALLATMPGDLDTEAEIHERFAHLRFGRTEQFRPAPELMEFIGRPLLVGPNPDAVEAMPPSAGLKKHILGIRGHGAYKEWLFEFAQARRKDMVDLVDEALESHAKAMGFEAPPKR